MTWVAIGSAAVGVAGSLLSKPKAATSAAPNVVNAYGETNTPDSAAIAARNKTFGTLNALQPQVNAASQTAAGATAAGAANPAFGAITNYGTGVLRGDYLNSPTVNNYATQAANRIQAAGADTASRTRAAFGNEGLGLSTGMTQALQTGNTAAAAEAAGTKSGIQMQNYEAERQMQQQAPNIISSGITAPISLAQQVPGQLLNPLQQQAGITSTLLGGQTSQAAPTLIQNPNALQAVSQGLSMGTSLNSMYGAALNQKLGGNAALNGGTNGYDANGNPVTYAPGYGPN